MQEVNEQERLTFSSTTPLIRNDSERAMQILGRATEDGLTQSEQVFLDLWLANFDSVKQKLTLLIDQYMDEPQIVGDLLRLCDKMDATLATYLRMQEQGNGDAFRQRVEDAAFQAEHELDLIRSHNWDDVVEEVEDEVMVERPQPPSSGPVVVVVEDTWDDFEPFDCPICFEHVAKKEDGFRLSCRHSYCRPCCTDVIVTAVNNAKVLDLMCPAGNNCESEFSYRDVRMLLDDPTFAKYEEFSLLAALAADPNVRWCPRKDCGNAMVNDDPNGNKKIVCDKCRMEFCFDCNEEWHMGTCEDFEKWRIENGHADAEFIKWSKDNTRDCPKCKTKIQKNGGCNHMTCTTCQYAFCWICGRKYTSKHFDPYNLAGCPGMQFTDDAELTTGKRIGFRILCGAGIVVAVPLIVALAVPVAVVGGSIYGSYRLHKYRKRVSRMRRYGY